MHELAADIGLDDFDVMEFPGPKSFDEFVEDMLGGFVTAPGLAAARGEIAPTMAGLRELLGPQRFDMVRDAINANLQMRNEPVLLTMPRVIMFR
jgi:hypothetical protein